MTAKLLSIVILLAALFACSLPAASHAANPVPENYRLCPDAAAPDDAPEKVHIECNLETDSFAGKYYLGNPDALKIVAYNVERGLGLEKIIELFKTDEAFINADIILASELDRGCPRTNSINVAETIALELGMDYIYAVEFVELHRNEDGTETVSTCEHGNALFSHLPITNARQIRHTENDSWYKPLGPDGASGQPRLGGRIAIAADIILPNGKILKAYSVHFESSIDGNSLRAAQAVDLIKDAGNYRGPVVIGGDMNTGFYFADIAGNSKMDKTPKVLKKAGFKDAHENIPPEQRGTTMEEKNARLVLDLIFTRSAKVIDAGICPPETCDGLSDHLPVWAVISTEDTN